MAIGADVKKCKQALRVQPYILVHKRKRTNPHQDDERAFAELKSRYRPKHPPLPAIWVMLDPRLLHEKWLTFGQTIMGRPDRPYTALFPTASRFLPRETLIKRCLSTASRDKVVPA